MTRSHLQDKPVSRGIKSSSSAKTPRVGKKPRIINETYLHNAGLYYLQRFAASTGQFRRVMNRKIEASCRAHPEQDKASCMELLETLIENFQRSGLLNDDLYAAGAIRSLRLRGLSSQAISTKMAIKGIDHEKTRNILAEIDSHTDGDAQIVAALRHARRRKIGPFNSQLNTGADALLSSQKALASLARAGFDYETARQVLDMDKATALTLIESSGL